MSHKRKCPECSDDIIYQSKYDMIAAERRKTRCRKCYGPGRKKKYPEGYTWKRYCSDCGKELIYTTKRDYIDGLRNNRKCRKCGCGHWRGKTKETNESLRIAAKKKSRAMKEHRKNNPPWNKGLTKETSEIIAKNAESHRGFKHTEKTKEIIRQASIEHWRDSVYREKVIANATIGIRKSYAEGNRKYPINRDTKPERAVEAILKKMSIIYEKQFPIYSSYPKTETTVRFYDFYLPEYNKIIEVHGDYWHANPNKYPNRNSLNKIQRQAIVNDADKIRRALNEYKEVFVIWEEDTKNEEKLYEKVSYILCATHKLAI